MQVLDEGPYRIQHQINDRYVDAYETDAEDFGVVTRGWQDNQTQKWLLTWVESRPGTGLPVYTIQHMVNDRYLDAHTLDAYDYRMVTREAQGDNSQKWIVQQIGTDGATGSPVCTIQQKENLRFADAYGDSENDYHLVTRTWQSNDSQKWILTFLAGEVSFTEAEYQVGEADGVAAIPVQRTGGTEGEATVLCETADGSATEPLDYVATAQTLEWADGDADPKFCMVTVNGDLEEEGNETVVLTLSDVDGAVPGSQSTATLTIEDVFGGPGLLLFTESEYRVTEHVGTALIGVQRGGGSDGAASVQCVTANGTATAPGDYTATVQNFEWADGEVGVKNCLVTVHNDTEDEDAETVALALSNAAGATLVSPGTATLTIGDDDNRYTVGDPILVATSSVEALGLPSVDIDSQGNFVVAFRADINGMNSDVHARSYDSSGQPLEDAFQVSDSNYGYDGDRGIAVSAGEQGDYFVVWDGYYYGVLARSFLGPENPDPAGQFQVWDGFEPGSPDVARLAADAFVVSWPWYFSILEGPNPPVGPEVQPPDYSPRRVTRTQAGGFLAVGPCTGALCVQRYDALGSAVGDLVNLQVDGNYPDIATLADGKAVVCWDTDGDVFCRLLDGGGALLGEVFPANGFVAGNQTWPQIAANTAGGCIVVWRDDLQDGGQEAMFAQVFDKFGGRAELEEFQMTPEGAFSWAFDSPAGNHPVTINESGDGVVVWATPGPTYAVYAQRIHVPPTVPIFADGFESGNTTQWSAVVGGS